MQIYKSEIKTGMQTKKQLGKYEKLLRNVFSAIKKRIQLFAFYKKSPKMVEMRAER